MPNKSWRRKTEGSPEWMTTYSDLVTLLLVFFVLIYSFSVLDVEKFRAFLASFQGEGILDSGPQPFEQIPPEERSVPGIETDTITSGKPEDRVLYEVYTMIKSYLAEKQLNEIVEVRYEDRGIAIDIKERILFDTGRTELKPEAKILLNELAGLFRQMPYIISVEGHTDNVPIHTREFPSNWELSTGRAVAVVRYFIEERDLDPEKLAAVGFGEFHPQAENDTAEGRAFNRRVVLMINARNIFASEVLSDAGTQSSRNTD